MSKVAKHSDLTQSEGDPTSRAYVELPETCDIGARLGPGRQAELRIRTRTGQQSALSKATTAFLLVAAGCMAAGVLHLIEAPEWAQLIGMLLPWLIMISQKTSNPSQPGDNNKAHDGR